MPAQNQHGQPRTYSAQDARGAEIILSTRTERIIFVAGLAAAMVLGVGAVIVGLCLRI